MPDTLDEPKVEERRGPGRPPKIPTPEGQPKDRRSEWMPAFKLLDVGSTVWWYELGDLAQKPMCAHVLAKYPESCSFDLSIWSPGHRAAYATREGVRHALDAGANAHQTKEVGCWLPNPETLALLSLME